MVFASFRSDSMRSRDSVREDKEARCHSLSFRRVHISAEGLLNPVFQPVRPHCCWNNFTDINNKKYWKSLQNSIVNL
jgi:hypothetical protein